MKGIKKYFCKCGKRIKGRSKTFCADCEISEFNKLRKQKDMFKNQIDDSPDEELDKEIPKEPETEEEKLEEEQNFGRARS